MGGGEGRGGERGSPMFISLFNIFQLKMNYSGMRANVAGEKSEIKETGGSCPRPEVDRGGSAADRQASGRVESHGVATGPEPLAGDCIRGKERVGS